jgi:hypothetical protein
VDGEVGRFEFSTHRVIENQTFSTAIDLFPKLQTNEYYRTIGFKELAMIYGDTERSYRKTATLINRTRYQLENGTSYRTLQENTEKEGMQLIDHIAEKSRQILKDNEFTEDGEFLGYNEQYAVNMPKIIPFEEVQEAARNLRVEYDIDEMLKNPVIYEDYHHSVKVAIDDVNVKKQKESRYKSKSDRERKRKYVHNTVAHVEKEKERYTLNGYGPKSVISFLIAFIFNNQLIDNRFQFFTDGHRMLNKTIFKSFRWYANIGIILDWYHLKKKCREQLSLAMKGRILRNQVLDNLLPLLWHGLTDRGIDLLNKISPNSVKSTYAMKKLVEYLKRNTPYIPCYAIRKELGLCNSSAIGEKMNDLIVSDRQKHNGMSWSRDGSVALASITSLKRNNESKKWFEEQEIDYKLAA